MKTLISKTSLLLCILGLISCQTRDKKKETRDTPSKTDKVMNIEGIPWPADSGRIRIHVIHDSESIHRQVMKGTVSRGTYITDTGGTKRQYIYVVYKPDSAAGCTDYAFYSWVKPSLEIDPGSSSFQPIPDNIADNILKGKAATGHNFKFGKWNPDYHVKWSDSMNKARKSMGLTPYPKLHLNDSLKDGQPYMPMPTPDGTGFLDGPSMTPRGQNNEPSPGERVFIDLVKAPAKGQGAKAPGPFTGRLKYIVKGQTYLYCLKQQQCLGFFTWTSTEIMTITIRYVEDPNGPPVFDLNKKNWKRGTQFTSISTITMDPWQTCYGL